MTEEKEENAKLLLSTLLEEFGSPGIVVDADVAARTGCKCYQTDDKPLCFSKGIIGTLSQPQVEAYCPKKEVVTEGITKRVKLFREAAEVCKKEVAPIPKGEKLEPFLHCMGREARARGIEL